MKPPAVAGVFLLLVPLALACFCHITSCFVCPDSDCQIFKSVLEVKLACILGKNGKNIYLVVQLYFL